MEELSNGKKEFKDLDFPSGTHYGFIAQEIEKILPGFVYTDSTEGHFKSVEYVKLTPILVEAIKEQQKMIDSLKLSNNKQDIELQQLKGSIHQKDEQLDSQKTLILKHEEELEKIRQYLGTEVKK